jgi:hypothetical protein
VTIPDVCFAANSDYDGVRASLEEIGFEGFRKVRFLNKRDYAEIPGKTGVYVLIRQSAVRRAFIKTSKAGWHKGKDPTIARAELEARWVDGVSVVYIGKAGKADGRATLRKRLRAYLRSGLGKAAGHWGGRAVWQLVGHEELIVAWCVTSPVRAASLESRLLKRFERLHQQLPFANRRR